MPRQRLPRQRLPCQPSGPLRSQAALGSLAGPISEPGPQGWSKELGDDGELGSQDFIIILNRLVFQPGHNEV